MRKCEMACELSKLSSKINEAFIELDIQADGHGSHAVVRGPAPKFECWLLAVSKRMAALMKVVFHSNYLIVIIGRSQSGYGSSLPEKNVAVVRAHSLSLSIL